jgi:hypothetical protein
MNSPTFNSWALAGALAFIGTAVVAEDLDAALEAQKKKAARRVYSERAVLADQNLMVPRPESEEDRLLDKKLQEMDAKADARPTISPSATVLRPAQVVTRPQEDENWLTAAVLDPSASVSLDKEAESAWIAQELDRHKKLAEQTSLPQEPSLLDENLRNRITSQSSLPELDSLKKYQLTPSGMSRSTENPGPGYMTPQSGAPDPMAGVWRSPAKTSSTPPAPFSPEAARLSKSAPDPLRSLNLPSITPNSGIPDQKSSSAFSYGKTPFDTTPKAPLSPLQKIKQTSPINRADPFTEDKMPSLKSSIWD